MALLLLLAFVAVCCCCFVGGGGAGHRHLGSVMKKRSPLQPPGTFTFLQFFTGNMLFCLLEYLQMLEHMENIWEKMQAYFSRWKRGGGGERGGFFLFLSLDTGTIKLWSLRQGFTHPTFMGGAGDIFCQLWRNFQLARVNNYKEKWKVVASKETSLTVQILFPIYCNPSCKGLISSVKRTPSILFSYLIFFASSEFNSTW